MPCYGSRDEGTIHSDWSRWRRGREAVSSELALGGKRSRVEGDRGTAGQVPGGAGGWGEAPKAGWAQWVMDSL